MAPISGGFANKTQNFGSRVNTVWLWSASIAGYVLSRKILRASVEIWSLMSIIGATYYFNKMSALILRINQLDGDNKLNVNNDDIVAVADLSV